MATKKKISHLEEVEISKQAGLGRLSYYSSGMKIIDWIKVVSKDLSTPGYILERLAQSSNAEVRIAVADHKSTPISVLLKLAEDDNPDIRYALAENHNLNQEVLRVLCNDDNPYVAQRAIKTLCRLPLEDLP